MQRKIELLEKISENALFHIDEFSFQLTVEDKGNMRKYFMELKVAGQSPSDVRFFLEEVAPEWEFLLESPKELTDYIKSYEEDNNPNDESLFHDLRTKYVEFLKRRESDSFDVTERIIILGFSVVEEKIYMVLKTFSLNVLSTFLEKLKQYCRENEIEIVMSEDVRWIELNQYVVRQKEVVRGLQSEEFLKRTLAKKLFPKFLRIFKLIDMDGYFEKGIYDEVMFQKEAYPNGSVKEVEIRQVSRFFSSYWKYKLSAKDKEILCLHDEKPDDKGIEKYVYTFKPSLLGYYLKSWFEDFTEEIIKRTDFSPYTVAQIMAGSQFNFFLDGKEAHVREIDVVIDVELQGTSKLIAIECKKTLSHDEIKSTNRKSRKKVLDSGHNVFDAFVHIGCFSNGVAFEKTFEGTKLNYKQDLVSSSDGKMDVPVYAFDIFSIEDYEKKLNHVIKDVFENW